MIDRILVAVDDTESSRRAAAVAKAFAATHGATLDAVHVADDGTSDDPAVLAKTAVADATVDAGTVELESHVIDGDVPEALEEHVRDTGADVVVIGRSDPSGVGERLFGGAVDRLLRRVDIPVLAVPETADVDPAAAYDDVLATTDGSHEAEAAAPWATLLAREFDATLHVLRVVDLSTEAGGFDAGGARSEYMDRLEGDAADDVGDFLAAADAADVAVERAVRRGRVPDGIDDYVREAGIDVVVIASERSGSLSGQLLGSVATKLLQTLDVPVLVVAGEEDPDAA
ncbi:universal stress protein [Halomicrobium salinisoli]|uniref:universal stress protein n=1 Tax=Halomicrobium salinisoli TaxID=2878391 RepID=UPI001CEFE090|nr:universal stress protein [Halomicrobium salinisoli]